MAKIAMHTPVRVRSGRCVDSERCRGGDLKGLTATVLSDPKVYEGPDGVTKEERVAVAFHDQAKAPVGIVDIATSRLEHASRLERVKAHFTGISFDKLGRIIRPTSN